MKKQSMSKVLELILDEVEAGRMPDAVLIRQGRSSLRSMSKSLKAATAASAASGKSGRKAKYDREQSGRYVRGDRGKVPLFAGADLDPGERGSTGK
jgi:hypothetical protein